MMKKINGTYMYNVATKQRSDINAAKLEGMIIKLGPPMKSSRMDFYKELQQYYLARMMQPTCSIQGSLASLCAILFTQLIVIITIILCSPTGLIFTSALLLFNFSENCNNYH